MWWVIGLVVAAAIWYVWSQDKKTAVREEPAEQPKPAEPENDYLKQMRKHAAAQSDVKIQRELAEIQAAAKRNQQKQ